MVFVDWQSTLAQYLIRAGTQGRKRGEITRFMERWANADMIENELNALQAEGKADKFSVRPANGRSGRSIVIWRATTKILE